MIVFNADHYQHHDFHQITYHDYAMVSWSFGKLFHVTNHVSKLPPQKKMLNSKFLCAQHFAVTFNKCASFLAGCY